MPIVTPTPGLVITTSVTLAPGTYDFRDGEGLVIAASDIVIEAVGVHLKGGCQPQPEQSTGEQKAFGYGQHAQPDNEAALGYHGTGLLMAQVEQVTVRGLTVSGFDMGVHLAHCQQITLDTVDASDCFHDPAWGWDEHGLHGGFLLEHCTDCALLACRAQRVWDAVNLRFCHHCRVENGVFSPTSDTGLKLWNTCYSTIAGNDFSWGLRIDPGEVHARDSSCALIESGSDHNHLFRNDMTHGGDGLFIRVLNGWMSQYNLLEENDCSYAHNNAVEAWSDHNTYVRNKANHASYGFWLGNSDYTVLKGNEVAFNGMEHHNAPEPFGNCGIAIVRGTGTHCTLSENDVHDNAGPGIAIQYCQEHPSFHWVIERNHIHHNKNMGVFQGHGIYLRHARNVTFCGNLFDGNEGDEVFDGGYVEDVRGFLGKGEALFPITIVQSPAHAHVGEVITFSTPDAKGLNLLWDLGNGITGDGQSIQHAYEHTGTFAVALTADNGQRATLAGASVSVLPLGLPFEWTQDSGVCDGTTCDVMVSDVSVSAKAVFLTAEGCTQHTLTLAVNHPIPLTTANAIAFFVRYHCDAQPDWKHTLRFPILRLFANETDFVELTARTSLMDMLSVTPPEAREAWRLFTIPLSGDTAFEAKTSGCGLVDGLKGITLTIGSSPCQRAELWLDQPILCKVEP